MIFNELRLPKFKRKVRHGTPELMPYSHLPAPGVTMLKDGSFLRSFRMYGPDLKSAGIDQRLAIKHHNNATLVRLSDGWMVQSDLVRFYTTDYVSSGPLPDPLTQLIENQREKHYRTPGTHLETALYQSLTYRPPSETENKARGLFFTDSAPDDERNLQHFLETTNGFAHDLSAYLRLDPLDSDEAVSFYESCIIGEQVQIRAPKMLNYLDTLIGRHRLVVNRRPTIGGRALRVVIPTGFPLESLTEIIDFLSRIPFPFRYSIRAILLGTQNAGKVISGIRKKHIQKQKRKWDFMVETTGMQSTPAYRNEHAMNMADDATEAAAEAESNQVREVYLSFGVVITDPEAKLADEKAEYVRAEFKHHQFDARVETFNTVEAWRGFIPGDGYSNRRKPAVNTINLSDFTFMQSLWTGHTYNPNPMYPPRTPPLFQATTDGLTPFRFHWHPKDDVGHGAGLGPIGAGKSTLADYMITQAFKIPQMQVFAFEKGLSALALTKACGGEHWHLGNDTIHAAPLINIDQTVEREWAHGYVSILLRLALNRQLQPREDEDLWRALELLGHSPHKFRTMTALQGVLQNEALKTALTRYTLKGPMGRYLDADRDELLDSRLITFELETLQNNQALEPVLLYLFHRIDQRLDGRPTFISLDEAAWVLLTEGVFGDQLEEWLINLRKKNAVVWLWSQSLDHVYRSRHRAIILQGCPSRIFLHDPDAETPNMAEVYRSFGLSDAEIRIIARELVPKRTYLLTTPNGSTVLDLELDPVTLSFVGAGSPEDLRRIRKLSAHHGEYWPAVWLRERNLPDAAAEFERLLAEQAPQFSAAAD